MRQRIFRLVLVAFACVGFVSAEAVPGSLCTYNGTSTYNPGLGIFQAPGLTCNLYPSTNTTGGTGTFDGNFVDIALSTVSGFQGSAEQVLITDGYLVVVAPTATFTYNAVTMEYDDLNMADWISVIEWAPAGGPGGAGGATTGQVTATDIDMWYQGCSASAPTGDTSCFPTYATIIGDPNNDSYIFCTTSGNCDGGLVTMSSTASSLIYSPSPGASYTPTYTVNLIAPVPEPATFAIGLGGLALIACFRRRRAR